MTISKYEIFKTIAEVGSLSKASEKLNITQSGVSYAISTLESELGFTLFRRERAGMSLTTNGTRILTHVLNILEHERQLRQEAASIKGLDTGTVRLGTLSSVSMQWLPGILSKFHLEYPHIEVKTYQGCYDEMNEWIANGTIDFGFIAIPTSRPFETVSLYKDKLFVILPPAHPLRHQKSISFGQIRNESFIMPQWGADDNIKRTLLENRVQLHVKYELMEERAIFALVQMGLGISILPELILVDVPKDIHIIELEPTHYRVLGIAALSLKNVSPAAKKFFVCVRDWLQDNKFLDFTYERVPPIVKNPPTAVTSPTRTL